MGRPRARGGRDQGGEDTPRASPGGAAAGTVGRPGPDAGSGIHDPTTPVFGREGEGNTGSPQPLRITHEELGSSRPFPAPKSRGRQVRRPAEGHCVCTKPTGSRTQGFPIATEFPTLQASPSCLRDRYHLHDAISSIITFFFFKPIHLNFSFISASFILSNTLTYSHAIKIGNIRLRSIQITSGGTCGVLSEAHTQHAFLSGG